MSAHHISYSTYTTKLPWKTFIRESEHTPTTTAVKEVAYLKFKGDEAKYAYERIVTEVPSAEPRRNAQFKQVIRPSKSNSQAINELTAKTGSSGTALPSKQSNPQASTNAILKAVERNDLQFLMNNVAADNVNLTDDFGWTPLMSAAYCGHMDIVEFLLNAGANRKVKDRSGYTAAQLALKRNHYSVVALIRRKSESGATEQLTKPTGDVPKINIVANPSTLDRMEALDSLENIANNNREKTKPSKSGFYCEICDATFYHASRKGHETSTLHIFNTNPKLPDPVYGIPKQNKGYQILLHTGWEEQGGLGPSGQGMKYPVKTCLKTDRKGIGQPIENEPRVTHFKPGDAKAIGDPNQSKPKTLKKRDRDKLLSMDARKERALRIALS